MVEQSIEQLVEKEKSLLRSIGKRQQLRERLDIGPQDPSARNLSQASHTVSFEILTKRITTLTGRLSAVSARIDEQVLPLGESYTRQLQTKMRQLRRVQRAGLTTFVPDDMVRFEQEVADFRQKPTQEPLLARGILVFNRRKEEVKQRGAQEDVRLTPTERRLMEALLPFTSEPDAISSSYWSFLVWPDISDVNSRKGRLKTALARVREKHLTDLDIVPVKPSKVSEETRYYLKVEAEELKVVPPVPSDTKPDLKPAPPPEDDFLVKAISPIKRYQLRVERGIFRHMSLLSDDTRHFLDDFLRSKDAWSILNCIYRFRNTKRERYLSAEEINEEELNMFYQHASGYFTEWLAFSYFYPRYLAENLILLSPDQKLTVYRNAHRGKSQVDNGFGLNPEIKDVPSPDSLLIKAVPEGVQRCLEVVSVVECKNVTSDAEDVRRYMGKQHARYNPREVAFNLRLTDPQHPEMPSYLGRLIHKLIPTLPALPLTVSPQMSMVYVVPKDSPSLRLAGIELQHLPISSREIAALVRLLPEALS